MANVYDYGPIVIDLKDYYTMRTECHQLDDVTLNFIVNNYDQEINIENFNVELRFKKPDGNNLIQKKDIKVVNNNIKIKCDSQLTIVSGKAKGELRLWESNGEQKTTCIIELNIISSALEVDRGISKTLITELEHLDNSLNGLYEAVDKVDKTKDEAIKLESDLRENINTGTTINNKLENNIPIATDINTKLEDNIKIAIPLNEKLEENITEGTKLKTNLEADILTGTSLKTGLEEDIQESTTLDVALKEDIKNANTTKEQLAEVKQHADTSKESLENATSTANTTKEELTTLDATAKETTEHLNTENVLADGKIETLKKLDPSNVLEDVGDLKQEVTEARGVYPNLNKRIENIIGKDVANLYIGETEPTLDGLWIDTTENNIGEVGSSDLLEDIKDYVNTDINPKIEENKKNIESINTDLNKNTQDIEDLQERFSNFKFYDGIQSVNVEFAQTTPIVTIVQAMSENSILIDATVGESNNVYPTNNGLLIIIKQKGVYRNICKWYNQQGVGGYEEYIGYVDNNNWSGWQQLATTETKELTLLNGWTNEYGNQYNLTATKTGKIVNIIGTIRGVAPTVESDIAILPEGFRPSKWLMPMIPSAGGTSFPMIIRSNGSFAPNSTWTPNEVYCINVSFPII